MVGILCFSSKNLFAQDTVSLSKNDTATASKKLSHSSLGAKIDYSSDDSLTFFLDTKDIYLYNNAKVDYEKMHLKSGFMSVNFETKILFAQGIKDTLDTIRQYPIFQEGNTEYKSKELRRVANEYVDEILRRTEESVAEALKAINRSRASFINLAGSADETVEEPETENVAEPEEN